MRKLIIFVGVVLVVCAIRVSAETITVRLPEVEGQFMTPETLTATFDLGTPLTFIGQARIRFKGTFYPGRAYVWDESPSQWFYYTGQTFGKMDPPESPGYWKAESESLGTSCSNFDTETTFSWWGDGPASWDFLLDGQGQVDTRLQVYLALSWVILEEAKAYINEAYLTIEEAIRLNNPNGDEVLKAGSAYTIQWTDSRPEGCQHSYDLQYSTDNGMTWMPLGSVTNECSHDWLVPETDSNSCVVRVLDANDTGIYDTSDGPFTICHCTLKYDLTFDCFVDFRDFAVLMSEWLQCGNPLDPDCGQ